MTEIVAAHLERVARELSYKLVLGDLACALIDFDKYPLNQTQRQQIDALTKRLAAALAACAREATVQGRNQGIAHCLQIVQNSRSTDEHANWLLKKLADTMGEALERAVGEKAPMTATEVAMREYQGQTLERLARQITHSLIDGGLVTNGQSNEVFQLALSVFRGAGPEGNSRA